MSPIEITPLTASDATVEALAAMLVEVVAHGGSVSFMHPLIPASPRASGAGRSRRPRPASGWSLAPGRTGRSRGP